MPDRTVDHHSALGASFSADASGSRLLEGELAERWRVSVRTLQSWRWKGRGPAYLRVCGRILYRIEDIVEFETSSTRKGTR